MSTHNLKSYKLAKLLVKDLTFIVSIMKDYEIKLTKYQKYTPVKKLLTNTKNNRIIIEHHLRKQRAIFSSKGLETNQELLPGEKNEKN